MQKNPKLVSVQVNASGRSPALQSKTVNSSTTKQVIYPDSQYDGLSSVTINKINTSSEQIRLYNLLTYETYFEYKNLSSLNEGFTNPVRTYTENYTPPLSELVFLKHYRIQYLGNMTVQKYYYDSTNNWDCMEFYFPNNISSYMGVFFTWVESTGTIYNSFSFNHIQFLNNINGNFCYSEQYSFNTRFILEQDKIIFKSNTSYFQNHSLSTTSGYGSLNIVTM